MKINKEWVKYTPVGTPPPPPHPFLMLSPGIGGWGLSPNLHRSKHTRKNIIVNEILFCPKQQIYHPNVYSTDTSLPAWANGKLQGTLCGAFNGLLNHRNRKLLMQFVPWWCRNQLKRPGKLKHRDSVIVDMLFSPLCVVTELMNFVLFTCWHLLTDIVMLFVEFWWL